MTSSTPRTLTDLPTEIIQHIFTCVPLTSIYSLRLTSKQSYDLTKLSDGTSDLVDLSPLDIKSRKSERGTAIARIEASSPRMLRGLTCSNCARIKYNDTKGFADDEYIQDNAYRMCIKCKMQENTLLGFRQKSFAVKGIPMFACNSCGKATELKFEASECVHILPATWVQMSTSFGGGAVKRRCRRCFLKASFRDAEAVDFGKSEEELNRWV